MAAPTFEDLVKRYGEKTAKWIWGMTHQTPGAIAAGEATTAAAGGLGAYTGAGAGQLAGAQATYGAGAAGVGTAGASGLTFSEMGAGGGALGNLGGTGVTAGSVASLAAPLVMTYLAYQAGSGVNEPVRKKYETAGLGKMLIDMANGEKIDPNTTREKYGIKPKLLNDYFNPNSQRNSESYTPGSDDMVDPRGYNPLELYEGIHSYGSGHSQSGGVGNSGWNDQQLDDMFGPNKDKIATLVGYTNGLPDWSNKRWDDPGAVLNSEPRLAQQRTLSNQYANLTDNDKSDLIMRNNFNSEAAGSPGPDEQWYKDMLYREKEREEIEKMLGYQLPGTPASQKLNQITNY